MEAIQLHQGRDGDVEVFRFPGEAIKRPCHAMPDGRRSHTPRPYGHTWRPLPRVQALQTGVARWKNLNYTSCRHASNVHTRGAILPHEEGQGRKEALTHAGGFHHCFIAWTPQISVPLLLPISVVPASPWR